MEPADEAPAVEPPVVVVEEVAGWMMLPTSSKRNPVTPANGATNEV